MPKRPQRAVPTDREPSAAQQAALEAMPQDRPVLMQVFWAWAEGAAIPPGLTSCLNRAKPAGCAVLTVARCDTHFIGQAEQQWHTVVVVSARSAKALLAWVGSSEFSKVSAQAVAVQALVASQPRQLMQRVMGLTRWVMSKLPAPSANRPIPSEAISGGVNPTPEQLEAFKACPQNTRIHMFNLLKFAAQVNNPLTGKPTTGKRLYGERYAPVAAQCIFRLGGRIVAMGRYRLTLIGAQGEPQPHAWDELVVAEYPGRSAFLRMLSNSVYQRAVLHREVGLQKTQLHASTPLQTP
ncbi:MAG: hypothetical protein ACK4FF_10130 [Limnobacter sp.]|uniref:hypothetical protein n=1 Tax=Limnobacter sp. TaxID=2003368 RepID=UPI00391B1649